MIASQSLEKLLNETNNTLRIIANSSQSVNPSYNNVAQTRLLGNTGKVYAVNSVHSISVDIESGTFSMQIGSDTPIIYGNGINLTFSNTNNQIITITALDTSILNIITIS